ncbi:hypothetical protein DXG01_011073, partial [Tephrocybe rancida]
IPPRFGLLDESTDRWVKFFTELEKLNKSSDLNTSYKADTDKDFSLVKAERGRGTYLGSYVTIKPLLQTQPTVITADPELTPIGERQALDAQDAWRLELSLGIPLPGKLYSSPMTRALKTCELTFDSLMSDQYRRPTVLENCREENGVHTCDKRRTASYIAKAFPRFHIEPGFTEEDLLWDPEVRETKAQLAGRAKVVLDQIFQDDNETCGRSLTPPSKPQLTH